MAKYKVISATEGIQYSGGGVYCVFGVCYNDETGKQYYFASSCTSVDFDHILIYSDYPYDLEGDCYPSFCPKDNADDLLCDELSESFRDFYDFWNQIFHHCEWYGLNPKTFLDDLRGALRKFMENHLKFTRSEAESELCEYFSAFPGTNGIILYNKFLSEIGSFNHRFYDLNKDDFEQMLRDNSMTVIDAVTSVDCEFDRNSDYCYVDADGMIHSTDFPEEVADWDSLYSYILDDGHDLDDKFIAEILANCNWR